MVYCNVVESRNTSEISAAWIAFDAAWIAFDAAWIAFDAAYATYKFALRNVARFITRELAVVCKNDAKRFTNVNDSGNPFQKRNGNNSTTDVCSRLFLRTSLQLLLLIIDTYLHSPFCLHSKRDIFKRPYISFIYTCSCNF